MADPIETMLTAIKLDLQAAGLQDDNTPVKTIFDTIRYDAKSGRQLPLIEFEAIDQPGENTQFSSTMQLFPFSIQFICWVHRGGNNRGAETRARNLRQALLARLHSAGIAALNGATQPAIRYRREAGLYGSRTSVGMGLIMSGDLALIVAA